MFSQEVNATDRRKFIKRSLLAGGALLAPRSVYVPGVMAAPVLGTDRSGKSRVVISRDAGLRAGSGSINADVLAGMVDRAMQSFFDRDDPLEAWRLVVRPDEVVGLKANCISGLGNSTTPQLVDVICERLRQVGVPANNIVIWDRANKDLDRGGFRISYRGSGIRCFGNEVLGFEEELETFGSAASLLCRTLTQMCDCVINLPVPKDHGIAGVTMALKNMFGAIHNPNKYHLNVGDPFIADVNMLPQVRDKTRLIICDATTIQYEGGPSYLPHWTWKYNGLMVGKDPVAMDHTGWQLIEKKRAEEGMKSLREANREPTYLATAADSSHRLGTNDPARIDVVEL